jgi:hypothetical protein
MRNAARRSTVNPNGYRKRIVVVRFDETMKLILQQVLY